MGTKGNPAPRGANDNVEELAATVARDQEHAYENACGIWVKWTLQQVEEVQQLAETDLDTGSEVYSRYFERVDPK